MELSLRRLLILGCGLVLLLSTSSSLFAGELTPTYIIYYGKKSSATEKAVCQDLKKDITRVTGSRVLVLPEPVELAEKGHFYLVGTPESSALIQRMIKTGKVAWDVDKMGPRGGLIHTLSSDAAQVTLLIGPTVEGEQNTVYAYAESVLGIDPLSYWTGFKPPHKEDLGSHTVYNRIVRSPKVPIICYMENDVDELANLHQPYLEYSMDTWKGMVNSLRRMRYNAIQLFDMLGRPEFFTRRAYKTLVPGYRANLQRVDSMIDYAHLKGMKIQIDLSLGYQFKSISDSEAVCWRKYKDQWIQTWIYYLTKTPLGKADIYSLRPRNQVWDRAYVSSCGEDKIAVFNEVFRVFDSLLTVYKPHAGKVCICYDDAMTMFNNGFSPPKDFIVAWSDDGYSNFDILPERTKGYAFGTYMHAGYWTNHTVHDPYPLKIDSTLSFMAAKYQAVDYLQVNGQTFRPFLLNLEAFARWASAPADFDGQAFYNNWCTHYFGSKAAPLAIASMKALHAAQFERTGYVRNLGQIRNLIGYLQDQAVISNRGTSYRVYYKDLHFHSLSLRKKYIDLALKKAAAGLQKSTDQAHFYYDFVYLPALMYDQLINFEITLQKAADHKHQFEITHKKKDMATAQKLINKAYNQLKSIYSTCLEGDKNPKWASWYDPHKRRPNNGFPTVEMIKIIQNNLKVLSHE